MSAFVASASSDGKLLIAGGTPPIEYRISDGCPYSQSASSSPRRFAHIVIHHTSPKFDTDWYVRYQIKGDKIRGGHFGYHFYISPEGRIVQGAPLSKRTNHISGDKKVRLDLGKDASNRNAIGISCVGAGTEAGFFPTPIQIKMSLLLAEKLRAIYGIPQQQVYGHGEIQSNRMPSEGGSVAKMIREGTAT